jgi:YbbR domain-containing protein
LSRLGSLVLRIVLALGLSLALWVFVSLSENPDEQATFEGLSIAPRGLSSGLVLVDQNSLPNPVLPTVNVTVVTDRRQRTEIRPVDLRAFVDLSEYGPGDYTVPVGIEVVRSDLSVTVLNNGIEPRTVSLRLEELVTATVPITLAIEGSVPFSFERGQPEIRHNGQTIEVVGVQGPQSRVQRVAAARAVANVDQLRASYSAPLELVPIDANGQVVEGVIVAPETVNVTIPVNPVVGLRLVPIRAAINGLPGSGYAIAGIEISPQLVTLTGNSVVLDRVEVVSTEPIDISGIRSTIQRQVDLIFPNGTSAGLQEPTRATVTVRVVQLTQPFQVSLPVQLTLSGLGRGLLFTFQPQVITVTVSGASEALGSLAAQPLLANIDVSGLDAGSYRLTPQISLPAGVMLVGTPPEVQVTLRAPFTPTPQATATTVPPQATEPAAATETPGPTNPLPSDTAEPAPSPTPEPASATPEPAPSATPTP